MNKTNVSLFIPKAELDAQENLSRFIIHCRKIFCVSHENLNWNDWHWKEVVNFTKLGVTSKGVNPEHDLLDSSFIEFAKAYFVYMQMLSPTRAKNEMRALRCIERAFIEAGMKPDISYLEWNTLDLAVVIARKGYALSVAYHAGRELERLARFVSDQNFIPLDLASWKNPIKRSMDRVQTGAKAKAEREKKLPLPEVLEAMAEIFVLNPVSDRDIFTTCVFAMLMCAPSRIEEVLSLPFDCEVEEMDSKGDLQYGWRFFAGKNYGPTIKWIPSVMVPIAKEAISRIKKITTSARGLASYIESNNATFFRHEGCPDIADDVRLTKKQVCLAMGWNGHEKSINHHFSSKNLKYDDYRYDLNMLWKNIVCKNQPANFPYLCKKRNLKYSDALFCMHLNQLTESRFRSPVFVWAPTKNLFNNDLSLRKSLKSKNHQNIFDRYNYLDSNKQRLKATSHQVRHLLSTLAERGGLASDELAKWAGRADAKQNRVYNHMSEYELVVKAEQLDLTGDFYGPAGELTVCLPVTAQEYNTLEKTAIHITEFGYCVHDFIMSPCDKYRDCLNCDEQVIVKKDDERLQRILWQLEETEKLLSKANDANESGLIGADRWYDYYALSKVRLQELVGILSDSAIKEGSLIKLKNENSFSQINRVLENTAQRKSLVRPRDKALFDR